MTSDENRPCNNAFRDKIIDTSTMKPFILEEWCVEISSLEQLLLFKEEVGYPIIIDDCSYNKEIKSIMIYNDDIC